MADVHAPLCVHCLHKNDLALYMLRTLPCGHNLCHRCIMTATAEVCSWRPPQTLICPPDVIS